MRFIVTTPVLNGVRYLNEAILSVVGQAGDFDIRYHVQDGGSTDGTIEVLEQWKARLANDFPILCGGVEFTYSSERDSGLYGAINHGFRTCGTGDVMVWVNADDRFEPGAFQAVASIFRRFDDIDWLCGRPFGTDEAGVLMSFGDLVPYPRAALCAGLCDGRFGPRTVHTEGTFYRQRLWLAAGGLNPKFKLAGDFDLFRRFAAHTDLVLVDAVLGVRRRRRGQLSEHWDAYCAEIDASLTAEELELRKRVARKYFLSILLRSKRLFGFSYRVVYSRDMIWCCDTRPHKRSSRPMISRLARNFDLARARMRKLTS